MYMIIPTQFSLFFTIGVIALLVLFTYGGYKDGFVTKVCELLTTILCIVIAWLLADMLKGKLLLFPQDYNVLSDTLIGDVIYDSVNRMLLFLLFFIVLRVLVRFLKPLFKAINKVPIVGRFNRILGSVVGFLQGGLLVFVIVFMLSTPLFANGEVILKQSGLSHAKEMYRNAMFMFDDVFDHLESIQKIVSPLNELQDDDLSNVSLWLEKQGFDELERQEIMEIIKHRNGQ